MVADVASVVGKLLSPPLRYVRGRSMPSRLLSLPSVYRVRHVIQERKIRGNLRSVHNALRAAGVGYVLLVFETDVAQLHRFREEVVPRLSR